MTPLERLIKRTMDVFLSLCGLLLLSPLLVLIAIAVKITSPGPILYRGVRTGRYGVPFLILKFRTMVPNAESLGGSATADNDSRLTSFGKFLRKRKLDELPQLINVLAGDMSLVGPRPEVPAHTATYTSQELSILMLRPGITDWASLWDIDEGAFLAKYSDPEAAYLQYIRPQKLRLQIQYINQQSILNDVVILLHTIVRLFYKNWTPRQILFSRV